MGGGLMQLVAYGAQDVYLTGNPQITFFKVVYRRHTNFAMEAIEQVFMGNVQLGKKTSCTISRNGDLIGRMYLEVDLCYTEDNTLMNSYLEDNMMNGYLEDNMMNGYLEDNIRDSTLVDRPGHAMIDYVEIEIGGQCIDKQYGDWMDLWAQLTSNCDEFHKLNRLVGGDWTTNSPKIPSEALPVTNPQNNCSLSRNASAVQSLKLYVPLQFWFNTNPGLALPLIALQYHEVKLNVMFNPAYCLDAKSISANAEIENICLFCDYIFLDTDERRRFAQVSHEYLIHQVQYNGKSSYQACETVGNIDLRFNHPCKEVVWSVQRSDLSCNKDGDNQPFNFNLDGNLSNNRGQDALRSAVIQLNGHDRFRERDSSYFRTVQPFQHHTGLFDNGQSDNKQKGMFYCYSFALKPEEHQPSGTCNFSRIDNAVLTLELNESSNCKLVKVYATNYNVLRIMSGMGGLAYSN